MGTLKVRFPWSSPHAFSERARRFKIRRNREVFNSLRHGTLTPLLSESAEAMYWIGFIMADGHVTPTQLIVRLSKKDASHLEQLAEFLNTKIKPWRTTVAVYMKHADVVRKMRNKYGFESRKTFNPPELSFLETDDKFLAFVAGFIDGDGCISTDPALIMVCHATWISNLRFFEEKLNKILGINPTKSLVKINKNGYAQWCIWRQDTLRILKSTLMALNLPLMQRKWNRISLSKNVR